MGHSYLFNPLKAIFENEDGTVIELRLDGRLRVEIIQEVIKHFSFRGGNTVEDNQIVVSQGMEFELKGRVVAAEMHTKTSVVDLATGRLIRTRIEVNDSSEEEE